MERNSTSKIVVCFSTTNYIEQVIYCEIFVNSMSLVCAQCLFISQKKKKTVFNFRIWCSVARFCSIRINQKQLRMVNVFLSFILQEKNKKRTHIPIYDKELPRKKHITTHAKIKIHSKIFPTIIRFANEGKKTTTTENA